ncbi:MAG: ABC transporter permease, partial [Thermoprotei archaeon]
VIGVLRALGIRRYEVLLNIVLEALILAVVAIISGIPLGVFVGSMLIQGGFLGFGGPRGSLGGVEFIVTNQTLIMVASITLLLTLIGALPPAYRAAKLEPARALRYE